MSTETTQTTAVEHTSTAITTTTTTTTITTEGRPIETDPNRILELIQDWMARTLPQQFATPYGQKITMRANVCKFGSVEAVIKMKMDQEGSIQLCLDQPLHYREYRENGEVYRKHQPYIGCPYETDDVSFGDSRSLDRFAKSVWSMYRSKMRELELCWGLERQVDSISCTKDGICRDDFLDTFMRSERSIMVSYRYPADVMVWATNTCDAELTWITTDKSLSPLTECHGTPDVDLHDDYYDNYRPVSLMWLLTGGSTLLDGGFYVDQGLDGIFWCKLNGENYSCTRTDLAGAVEVWTARVWVYGWDDSAMISYLDKAMHHLRAQKELAKVAESDEPYLDYIYVTNSDGTAHRYMDIAIVEKFFGDSVVEKAKTLTSGDGFACVVDNAKVNFRTKEGKDLATITSLTRLS